MQANDSNNAMKITTAARNLPFEVKRKLLALSEYLPFATRGEFLRRTGSRLAELVSEHPRTLVFPILGFFLGTLIENTTTLPWMDGSFLGSIPSDLGMAGGLGYGFWKDREAVAIKNRITTIMREELLATGVIAR